MARHAVDLRPLPGVTLRVEGDQAAVDHFAAEYGPTPQRGAMPPRLSVRFLSRLPAPGTHDGHKTAHWEVALDAAGDGPATLSIALKGFPRWFGLSLVQGYLVEPYLSLLAPDSRRVLLPSAGIVRDGAVDLLVGRSRTGKSSLSVRALAAGLAILGDDQVVVSADGTVARFPRRLRVYDDLASTAPLAVRRLPARYRAGLVARSLLRTASRGRVAPSLAVPGSALGTIADGPLPLRRVILLSRGASGDRAQLAEASLDLALDRSTEALDEQRTRLLRSLGPTVASQAAAAAVAEGRILRDAFSSVPAVAVELPTRLDAATAVAALAQLLGLP